MKVALITIAKPQKGSGDGITEYTYQLYNAIKHMLKVDLIYAVSSIGRNDVFGLLKTHIFPYKINEIVHNDYDVVHITNHEVGFLAKKIKQKSPNTIIITTIHDLLRFNSKNTANFLQKFYDTLVQNSIRDAINYSDFLIFNSTQTKTDVNRAFPNLVAAKYKVIYNGIDASFSKRIPKKPHKNIFVIGYIGSLAAHKNAIAILSVANLLKNEKNIKFKIYGTGATKNLLHQYAKNNKLKNVEFKGFASRNNLVKIFDLFDVFIFPSLHEGFGMPILEAQARGLPVIIYKNAKIPTEVRKYCIETNMPKPANTIIKELYNGSTRKPDKNVYIKYSRHFSWDKTSKETSNIYNALKTKGINK